MVNIIKEESLRKKIIKMVYQGKLVKHLSLQKNH